MKRSELFFAFLLIPVDVAMIIIAFALAYFFRSNIEMTPLAAGFGLSSYLTYALYYLPFWFVVAVSNGLFRIRNYSGYWSDLYKIILSVSTSFFCLVFLIFLSQSFFFSRLILAFTWIIAIITIFTGRAILKFIQKYLLKFGIGRRVVLIIGENNTADKIEAELIKDTTASYKIIGSVTIDGQHQDHNAKYLGSLDNLNSIIKKHHIDEIILCEQGLSQKRLLQLYQICVDNKIVLKQVPDLLNIMRQNFVPTLVGTIPVLEMRPIPLDGWGRILKRFFDLVLAIVLLIFLSPLFALIALLVKISSKGPVIYRHQRVGKDGKIFDFYKFRSMYYEQCDFEGGTKWTTKEDEKTRITPIGKILRKTNFDELPQLVNIFLGDMSFVGPRPELPKHVEKFQHEIPDYFRRHRIKVGLTGWAQVNGLKGDTSIAERVEYDIYYIENWSFWFDLKIIFKTGFLVLDEIFHGKSEYRTRS